MNYLPEGFENLRTQKNYWKMSEMKDGDNKLRIVQRPIAGWIDWVDNKPKRFRPLDKPVAFDASKPVRPFWAIHVWDYSRESLFILEVSQASILKALTNFGSDQDWGDFTQYDLKINKSGNGKDTRYTITPLPHKPLNEKIKEAVKKAPVNLEALYDGLDPWSDFSSIGSEEKVFRMPSQLIVDENSINDIEQLLKLCPIDFVFNIRNLVSTRGYPDFVNMPITLFDSIKKKVSNKVSQLKEVEIAV